MTNLDPQTTADFWDAYVRAAGGGAKLAQAGRTFSGPTSALRFGSHRRIQPAA